MENVDHGLLEHWLLNIRNVQRLHFDELKVKTVRRSTANDGAATVGGSFFKCT